MFVIQILLIHLCLLSIFNQLLILIRIFNLILNKYFFFLKFVHWKNNLVDSNNSTLRYECDKTFSDECEFAARTEGEWCNHTSQENVFRTSIVPNFISRGVKMRIFAHEAWVKPHFTHGVI